MVKRKGNYVKTTEGIYDLDDFKNIFGLDGDFVYRIDNPKIKFEVLAAEQDLFNFIRFNQDIIEVHEPSYPIRFTIVKDIHDFDTLLTNEGLVHISNITAILDYNDFTDSYVRYKIVRQL
jgi:hypothetical protein